MLLSYSCHIVVISLSYICHIQSFGVMLLETGEREFDASNSAVSFQLAQVRVGAYCVPVSLVIYIDSSFIKHGIPVKPIYGISVILLLYVCYTPVISMSYSCLIYVILLSYICHTPVVYMSYSCRIYVILLSYICHTYSYCLSWAVASRNNDRTVASKAFAWRLLGMMQSISKPATIVQTDEWRSERRTRLYYHSCVDIVSQQINDLNGRDIFLRFGDQKYRRSRVFLDFLCMDGDEVSHATMCPTTRCTSCWCPKQQMSDTDSVFAYRDTAEVHDKVAEERKRLLHRDGRPRDGNKQKVILLLYVSVILLSYFCHTPVVYMSYSCRIYVILLS
jgi:hypothetical protein